MFSGEVARVSTVTPLPCPRWLGVFQAIFECAEPCHHLWQHCNMLHQCLTNQWRVCIEEKPTHM